MPESFHFARAVFSGTCRCSISNVCDDMTSWHYFTGCNKRKIDQDSGDKQLVYHTCPELVSLLFSEVCKHTTSMGLLNSYESDECSAEEPVETLSEECLLGSDDCAFANFSFQLSIPSRASNINPAMCTKV